MFYNYFKINLINIPEDPFGYLTSTLVDLEVKDIPRRHTNQRVRIPSDKMMEWWPGLSTADLVICWDNTAKSKTWKL